MTKREKLGQRRGFGYREIVYRTADAFEIDEIEGYDITRKRVFFDDVVLVTLHRFIPWGNGLGLLLLAGLVGLVVLALAAASTTAALVVAGLGVLPALAGAVASFALGARAVTVQGKRTQARMDFVLRPGRAEEVYRLACRLARERQPRPARPVGAAERGMAPPPPAPPEQ